MRASQPKRILVVDDEPHVAMVLAEALSKLPEACELLIAENATQALAKAKTQPIDFLITDFQMPDADGLTLITALRKLSPNMATILMTAHGTEQVERRAEKLGVDQFMPKPFNLADFRRVAWQALEKTRQAAPPAPQPVPHALASQLQQLLKDTGAHCACLIHNGGGLIESVGSLSDRDTQMLATLMAANFAAMTELARLLGNPRSFEAVNHESKDDNIYTCVAGAEHLLVVVFGWAARRGPVWYHTKKMVAGLQGLLEKNKPTAAAAPPPQLAGLVEALAETLFGEATTPPREIVLPPASPQPGG